MRIFLRTLSYGGHSKRGHDACAEREVGVDEAAHLSIAFRCHSCVEAGKRGGSNQFLPMMSQDIRIACWDLKTHSGKFQKKINDRD